jgi:rod shape-determining protein MreD
MVADYTFGSSITPSGSLRPLAAGRAGLSSREGLTGMNLTIAAAGAAAVALLEVTLWPYLGAAGTHLHPVLAGAILLASLASLEVGLTWAFTGGLMLDVLSPRPLGTTILVLLLVVGVAVGAARGLAEVRLAALTPVLVAFPVSLLYSVGVALVVAAAQGAPPPRDPLPALVPGAIADTVVVALVVAIALSRRSRREEQERVGW